MNSKAQGTGSIQIASVSRQVGILEEKEIYPSMEYYEEWCRGSMFLGDPLVYQRIGW